MSMTPHQQRIARVPQRREQQRLKLIAKYGKKHGAAIFATLSDLPPNGCFDRKDFVLEYPVPDGHELVETKPGQYTALPLRKDVPNPNTRDCQYSIRTVDPRCFGCDRRHIPQGEQLCK